MTMKQKNNVRKIILSVLMLFLSLIIIIPLLIMLLGSVKNPTEAQQFNLSLPTEWHFENYVHVFQSGGIAKAMLNSTIITLSVTALVIIFGGLCAFVVSRRQSGYTKKVYYLFLDRKSVV